MEQWVKACIVVVLAFLIAFAIGMTATIRVFGFVLFGAIALFVAPFFTVLGIWLNNKCEHDLAKVSFAFSASLFFGTLAYAFVPGIAELGRETATWISRAATQIARERAAPQEVLCTNEFSDPRTGESVMFYRTNTSGVMICYEHAGHVLGEPLKPVTRDLWQANLGRMNAQRLAEEKQAELAAIAKRTEEEQLAAEQRMKAIEEKVKALKERPAESSSPAPSPISESQSDDSTTAYEQPKATFRGRGRPHSPTPAPTFEIVVAVSEPIEVDRTTQTRSFVGLVQEDEAHGIPDGAKAHCRIVRIEQESSFLNVVAEIVTLEFPDGSSRSVDADSDTRSVAVDRIRPETRIRRPPATSWIAEAQRRNSETINSFAQAAQDSLRGKAWIAPGSLFRFQAHSIATR